MFNYNYKHEISFIYLLILFSFSKAFENIISTKNYFIKYNYNFQNSSNVTNVYRHPTIIRHVISTLQKENIDVCLPCDVLCLENYTVFWTLNDKNIYAYKKPKENIQNDLCIKDIKFKKNMGFYTCFVKNKYGTAKSTTFLYPFLD